MVKVIFKIRYLSDTRRLSFDECPNYNSFMELIASYTHILLPFTLKYTDDENDLISLTNEREMTEAWTFALSTSSPSAIPILRLTMIPDNCPPPSVPTLSIPPSAQPIDGKVRVSHTNTYDWDQNTFTLRPTVKSSYHCKTPPPPPVPSSTFQCPPSAQSSDGKVKISHTNTYDWDPKTETLQPSVKKACKNPARKTRFLLPVGYYSCAVCDERIVGDRYRCKECDEFDLCSECETAGRKVHDQGHEFVRWFRLNGSEPKYEYSVPCRVKGCAVGYDDGKEGEKKQDNHEEQVRGLKLGLLEQLESMGFQNKELNSVLLRKNGYNLAVTVNDLLSK